ncbi:MAG: hypothetical protein MJ159_01885 [Treponemataceae bacterium]|nr:hypothetical protein [Treponemataceae bacterium]
MKKFVYYVLQLFIDILFALLILAVLFVIIFSSLFTIIDIIANSDITEPLSPYIKYLWILYLLFSNTFFISIGCLVLRLRYKGNKILIFISNLFLILYWLGAYKQISVLQILGVIDFIGFFIPKINNRLINYLFKIALIKKDEKFETIEDMKE